MEITIKNGELDDLTSINEIYNYYVRNSNATFDTEEWDYYDRLDWFKLLNNSEVPYHLLVAKDKGQIIGFAYNSKFKERKAYFTSSEVTVYIRAGFEGNGLGAKLYDALFNLIGKTSLHRLYAAITIPNAASIKLHERNDFKLVGTMEEVGYKNGEFHSVSLYEKLIGCS